MARSKRKLLGVLLSVGVLAGLLATTQIPANAQTTPSSLQQYMPSTEGWTGDTSPNSNILSDRQDGTDTAAHLTAVATNDTDRVVWYVCPTTVDDANPGAPSDPDDNNRVTSTELASCQEIGRDEEARTPNRSGPGTQIDEAYDVTWNITADQEGNRDILALACIGTGERIEGSNLNCTQDLEENIFVDSTEGEDPTTASSAGEIATFSTACGTGGPGVPACAAATANSPAANTYQPFPHGSTVPQEGFTFRATTSADVDVLRWGIDADSNGATAPEAFNADSSGACTELSSSLNARTWQCNVPDAALTNATDNTTGENALAIYTGTSGSIVTDNQVLDVHYIVTSQRGTVQAVHTFFVVQNQQDACNNPVRQQTNVTDGQQRPPSNRQTGGPPGGPNSGNEETLLGCLFDRFTQQQQQNVETTMELSGVATGGYVTCINGDATAGTLHDHDGNGYYEHCHATTAAGGNGIVAAQLDNYALTSAGPNAVGQPGTSTSRFCVDVQNDRGNTNSTTTPPVGHGCADESATSQDTVTKEWTAVPSHVHLVFANTGDTANPCHTGDQFKENTIGDGDTLLACTMDNQDRPATTQQTGGGRLQWDLRPNTSGQQTATRFDCESTQGQCPPSESDANGQATVAIEAINEGTDTICVTWRDDQGNFPNVDCVQKRVRRSQETPTTTPPPTTVRHDRSVNINRIKHVKLNRRSRGLLIRGNVNSPDFDSCASQVPIKVQIRKGGAWITRKSDTTDQNGVFKVLIRDITGRYRAIAPKHTIQDTSANTTDICARAADRARHRHGRR